MVPHVCPWWAGYLLDNPLRRLIHSPEKMFGKYVRPGMTVLDLGCGMGFTSLALAKMVGDQGCVIAADLQREMMEVLRRRAAKAGLSRRIRIHACQPDSIGVHTPVDFAVAFWMVHEAPDTREVLSQVRSCLKPNASFLVVEPALHVSDGMFREILAVAEDVGLKLHDTPKIRLSKAAVFTNSC